jgi:hypothetical protein
MPSAQQSAWQILALAIAGGATSGSNLPFLVDGTPIEIAQFSGTQKQFFQSGFQISDLIAGLAFSVSSGWLIQENNGQPNPAYQLTAAGFSLASAAQQSGEKIVSQFVTAGARPGHAFSISISSNPPANGYAGAIEAQFLQQGITSPPLLGLIFGLAYAVAQGWLTQMQPSVNGDTINQAYRLELSGFTEAGGTAPTQAESAQQLLNVAAAINDTPDGARFNLNFLTSAFTGTVGSNTFAPEDILPGYGFALAQGWVRPADGLNEPVFSLTAAGVAQAA